MTEIKSGMTEIESGMTEIKSGMTEIESGMTEKSRGLKSACAVADYDRDDYRLMAVFLCERCLCLFDECIVELGLYEVDGAAAETAAHDA